MDKTIGLMVTAAVVMMLGVAVMTVGSNSLTDFDDQSSELGNEGCEFQQERAIENPDYRDQLSEECRDEDFEQLQQEQSVVSGAIDQLGG